MGIDVHGLNLLRFAAASQALGDVVTLGRQGLNVAPYRLRDLLGTDPPLPPTERYCERLLVDRLGARSVESVDNSDYEGATHLADLNVPVVGLGRYDTVVDAGTIEHVFDVREALANVSRLCAAGGQILHVLPANNQNGHGFWQFSPELFFSLYSPANGYRDTRVFLASEVFESRWFEVLAPQPGERVNVTSLARSSVLVRTVRGDTVTDGNVHQSDYVQLWSDPARLTSPADPSLSLSSRAKHVIDRSHTVSRAVRGGYAKAQSIMLAGTHLSRRHRSLRKIAVADLLASVDPTPPATSVDIVPGSRRHHPDR